jgi:hypothetical protein
LGRRGLELERAEPLPRGISLFLPIPRRRNCAEAGIPLHSCICYPKVKVSLEDPLVNRATTFLLNHLNDLVAVEPSCAVLKVGSILGAESRINVSTTPPNQNQSRTWDLKRSKAQRQLQILDLGLTVQTLPGYGLFEATLLADKEKLGEWTVSGSVSRINMYQNQSSCVEDPFLKQYCFCLPPIGNTTVAQN